MNTIHILPDTLINQIAAGEVVERPASVVKELVENSLDAGADQITIEIEQGGAKLISIRDNGCGMNQEDALLAFARHATSKISNLDDLSVLTSFGFRGEALASVASVAQVTLRTRQPDANSGHEVVYHGGKCVSKTSAGCPIGTEIRVENLFFNTPARQKFLKAESTETSHCAAVVSHMAIANPKVGFVCIVNGKTLVSVPKSSGARERLAAILGNGTASEMIPVLFETPSIRIHGYVSRPGTSLASKKHQYLFVNSRDVADATIARAVSDAYGSRIPGRMYPSFVLQIDLDPKDVDVNVHPRKLTVKFVDSNRVYRDVRQAVSQALDQFQDSLFAPGVAQNMRPMYESFGSSTQSGMTFQAAPSSTQDPAFPPESLTQDRRPEGIAQESFPFQILGQIADSYILIFKEDGLAIVDQHAAHERILYERFCTASGACQFLEGEACARDAATKKSSQPLLSPLCIETSPQEKPFVSAAIEFLNSIGFEAELWSGETIQISAFPTDLSREKIESIIKGLLTDIADSSSRATGKVLPERMLKSMACKSAIKFGMRIAPEEQRKLLQDLMHTPNNSTCPHGRPTQILVTFDELERRFYRKK